MVWFSLYTIGFWFIQFYTKNVDCIVKLRSLCFLQEEKNKVHKERVEERRFTFLSLLLVCFLNIFAEKLPISGQRRGAESENQVEIETEGIAVTVGEMLTVGVEIVTGIMTTVNMTETMTQEAGGTGPGLGKDTGIMITAAGKL